MASSNSNVLINVKKFLPWVVIILIIALIGNRYYFSGTSNQEYPRTFLAQDTYWDLLKINDINDYGSRNLQARVLSAFHPAPFTSPDSPILHYAVNWIGNLFGIENYVAVHVLLIFAFMMEVSILYLLMSRISKVWAWLALPFMLVGLMFPFIAGINWGFWRSYFATFMFFLLTVFYPFEFKKKHVIGFTIVFSIMTITHPFIAPYTIILLIFGIFSKPKGKLKNKIIKFAAIGISSVILFFDYIFSFLTHSIERTKGEILKYFFGLLKYTLYAADPKVEHLGVWFWISLMGFALAVIYVVQNRNKIKSFKIQTICVLIFIYFMYLFQIVVQRLQQFRLTWPLLVGVFIGFLLYLVIQILPKRLHKETVGFILFFLLLIILQYTFFDFPSTNFSIVSKDLYKSYIFIKENSPETSTVLLIDPLVGQVTGTLLSNRHVRYIDQQDFMNLPQIDYNLSKVLTKRSCVFPTFLRTETNLKKNKLGYGLEKNNLSSNLCLERPVELCENNFLVLNYNFRIQEQIDVMKIVAERVNEDNFEVVFSTSTSAVFRNKQPCGTWVPEYIMR